MSQERKNNLFKSVPVSRISRNMFDLSHEVKMSGKFGYLYPVLLMDAVPGDTIRDEMTAMVRAAPMLAPIMHRVDITTHFFFVPNRLVTDHWEDFITGGPGGITNPILPYITPAGVGQNAVRTGTLWDYLGLPTMIGDAPAQMVTTEQISVLPFWAYYKIWMDYYRDPNLDSGFDVDTSLQGNVSAYGNGITSGWAIKRRGWEKDYYTAALPWAQRGAEVLMPLAGTGSVTYLPISQVFDEDGLPPTLNTLIGAGNTLNNMGVNKTGVGLNGSYGRIENIDEVEFDASSITINDFRRTLAIQKWLENNARGGGRYIEQIQSHFNVRVPDYRLQRAEYLGGGRQPLRISEVVSTGDGTGLPLGEMAGHGISVGKSNRFTYRCQEHGWIMGILSIMPRTGYFQGIDKMWSRLSKYDYAWPEMAHLGEQEIVNKEVFFDFDEDEQENNEDVFGYIPRYAEYKFKNDRVAGDFRTSLRFWHLGRFFTARPGLNEAFTTMYENSPLYEETFRRIFAVQDGTDYFWMQLFHKLTAKRPLPYFGVPTI